MPKEFYEMSAKKSVLVYWHRNERNGQFEYLQKVLRKKTDEFDGRNVVCIDLTDLERFTQSA